MEVVVAVAAAVGLGMEKSRSCSLETQVVLPTDSLAGSGSLGNLQTTFVFGSWIVADAVLFALCVVHFEKHCLPTGYCWTTCLRWTADSSPARGFVALVPPFRLSV